MPKKKTSKTAAKRVRRTAKGHLKFGRPGKGHLLSSKSAKQKRRLRRAGVMSRGDEQRIRPMIET